MVRAVFLASNRGDVDELVRWLDPEIEWESVGMLLQPAGISRGHDAVRAGLRRRTEHFGGHPRVTLTEIRAEGSRVLVQGVVDAPGGHRLPETWICEFRNGLLLRMSAFTNPGEGAATWQRRMRTA